MFINTYLKCKMKFRKVRIIGSLEHVSLEMNVGDFVHLEYLLFVNLFEGEEPVVQVYEGDLSVGAATEIFY